MPPPTQTIVNKVSPMTRPFKNKSFAPFKYLAVRITLTKKAVKIISLQKVGRPLSDIFVLKGFRVAIPGSSFPVPSNSF
jgi:hypothetical protein